MLIVFRCNMPVDCYLIFCPNQGSALFLGYLNVQPEQSDALKSKPAVLKKASSASEADVYDKASTSTSNLERRSRRSNIKQTDIYYTVAELGLETCIALQKKHADQSEGSLKEARVRYSSKRKESKEVFQSTEPCQEKDTADDEIYENPVFTNNHEDSYGDEVIRTLHQISEQVKCNGINYEDKKQKQYDEIRKKKGKDQLVFEILFDFFL